MSCDDRPHTHPCTHCQTPVECAGELARNFDGWPPTICLAYHRSDGTVAPFLCEACALSQHMACDDCGEPAVKVLDDADDASGYRGDKAFCLNCIANRERHERVR